MSVEDSLENYKKCLCQSCPSYLEADVVLYCAKGKSVRDISKQGCLCEECLVFLENNLTGSYYCLTNKES